MRLVSNLKIQREKTCWQKSNVLDSDCKFYQLSTVGVFKYLATA